MAPRESQPQPPSQSPSSSQSLPSFAAAFPGYSRPSASSANPSTTDLPPIQVMDPPPRLNGRKRSHNDEQASPPSPQVKDEIDELDESASSAPQGKRRRVTVSGSQRPEAPPAPAPMRTTLPVSEARRGSLPGVGSMLSPAPVPARLPPVPSQHAANNPNRGAAALPAPSISFTSRRLGGGTKGKKPADILISPRDAAPPPGIMSAPPAVTEHNRPPVPPTLFPPPHHHHPPPQQSHLHGPATPGLTIPSVPSIGAPPPRRTAAAVPPTPGRMTMRGALQTPSTSTFHIPERERGGDRTHLAVPSVGISGGALNSPRVPPTPGVLRSFSSGPHPGPSSAKLPVNREKERDAFLSPFAGFYDTLRDAAELKAFLAASVHKAERAAASIDEAVERRVEERVAPIRNELDAYKRRVDAIEEEMRSLRAGSAPAETLRPREGYQFPAEQPRSSQSPEIKGKEREKIHEQSSGSPPSEQARESAGP
ncbi:hypothetical protein PENSPDRAFT_269455 [Peniophora sp. CONT]|nr:hypothetical protein PENSPDRAFT_269455 [Peniophora sp. CONT]